MSILVALATLASACAPVQLAQYGARRIFREAGGIRYDAFPAEPLNGDLSTYERLEVETLQNEMEDRIPAELVSGLNEQILAQLQQVKPLEVVRAGPLHDGSATDAPIHNDRNVAGGSPAGQAPFGSLQQSVAVPAQTKNLKPPMTLAASGPRVLILRGGIVDFDPGRQSLRVLQIGVGRQAVLTVHVWFVDRETGQSLGKYVVNSEIYRIGTDAAETVSKLAKGLGEIVARMIVQNSAPTATTPSRKTSHPATRKPG